jgi:prepilin-type processing-associated H-X9-DG protein
MGWYLALELPLKYEYGTNFAKAPTEWMRLGGVYRCPLNGGRITTITYGVGSGQPVGSTEELLLPVQIGYGYNAEGIMRSIQYPTGFGLGGEIPKSAPTAYAPTHPTSASAVRSPSEMICLGDAFTRSRNASSDGLICNLGYTIAPAMSASPMFTPASTIPPKQQPGFVAHHGRANRAFADGHVETEDMRRTFGATDDQLRHWNVDNQPHRGLLRD